MSVEARRSPGARAGLALRRRGVHAAGVTALVALLAGDAVLRPHCPTAEENGGNRPRICAAAGHDLRAHAAFEQAMGRSISCAVVFSDQVATWSEWERPWFAREPSSQPHLHWASWVRESGGPNHLVVSHSLIPARVPDDWRARGARGEYDAHARRLAAFLVERGLGDSTIRLAHEPNGDWFRHSVGDTAPQRRDWAAFWRRTVLTMRAVPGADFTFDLSINAGVRPLPISEYYPGDDVVDVIGVDQYDSLPSARLPAGPARWRRLASQSMGLSDIRDFAATRGKPLSIPEYGLLPESRPDGAGDNPAYVEGLARVVAEDEVAYLGSFESANHDLLPLPEAPASLAVWRRHFGEQACVR